MDRLSFARRSLVTALVLVVGLQLALVPEAPAYTSKDPVVQEMVEKAIRYLENTSGDQYTETLGGKCLVAMAIFKHRKDRQHPKIAEAVAACQRYASGSYPALPNDFNYSLGLAIIFLCEFDSHQYASEIQALQSLLQSRQRPDGAWSYPMFATGDNSQTQYAALATWMAHTHGFSARQDSVEAMGNWIMRVQDISGAFPYQGKDPGNLQRIQQDGGDHGIRLSMSPAALGALYITADILNISMGPQQQEEEQKEEEVFQKVPDPSKKELRAENLNADRLKDALKVGINYFDRNFAISIEKNQHYYLYSIERYYSFREHLEKQSEAEPKWYNLGVEFLKKTQGDDGAWEGMRGKSIDSAFSVLFLLRSTKEVIRAVADGNLIGGFGLPEDLSKIKLQDGAIVGTDIRGDIGSLMDLIESGETLDSDSLLAQLDELQFRTSKERDTAAFDRLKQMVSGENYQARLLAVRALANSGDLENVPVLIYALSDPDGRVAREANEGLRLLSRRLSAPPLPEEPSLEQKRAAQYAWRDWLKSVDPSMEIPPDVFQAGE